MKYIAQERCGKHFQSLPIPAWVTSRLHWEWPQKYDLVLLGVSALLLRLIAVFLFPNVHHPDEVYQFLEPAHRLAFGYGIVTWEFEEAARSLVIPFTLSLFLKIGSFVSNDPAFLVRIPQFILILLSLIPVFSVYHLGCRSSRFHGWLAAFVAATWFESVYFAAKPLGEILAGYFLTLALCYISERSRKAVLFVGLGLGLASALRIQLVPIAGLAAAYYAFSCGQLFRWPFIATFCAPFVVFGTFDWIYWNVPFSSYANYFRINFLESRASDYGVSPSYWYFLFQHRTWAGFFPLAFVLAFWARKECLPLILSALGILVSHSFIPHKEYRFTQPAFTLLVLASAIGAATFLNRLTDMWPKGLRRKAVIWLILLWASVSLSLGTSPAFKGNWFREAQYFSAAITLFRTSSICGVLTQGNWAKIPYFWLHRHIPIYSRSKMESTDAIHDSAYNAVVATAQESRLFFPRYQPTSCFLSEGVEICVLVRDGSCEKNSTQVDLLHMVGLGTGKERPGK